MACPLCESTNTYSNMAGTNTCDSCGKVFTDHNAEDPDEEEDEESDGALQDASQEYTPDPNFECRVCSWETHLTTPHGRTRSWCQRCDESQIFERL